MAALQKLVDAAVTAGLEQFAPKRLRPDELAVTLVDLRGSPVFIRSSLNAGEGRDGNPPKPVSRFEPLSQKVTPISRSAGVPSLLARADQEIGATVHGEEAKETPGQIPSPKSGGKGESEPPCAQHRGDAPVYPASVVKLFYLVAAHRQMEDGQISDTPELRRALHDMIVHSGNEATGYVLDVLTGTTSGPELPPAGLAAWHDRRNTVNRYFHALGYPEINANRKTWHDGPYGRDRQAVEQFTPARNSLTTNATARLLVEIATGRCVSAVRSAQMLELLRRDFADPDRTDKQACEFIGAALPAGAKLWSKAGYMSAARHDAALLELPGGARLALVIFTTRPDEPKLLQFIAQRIVGGCLIPQT